jgi:CDP-glucose 4,6-dehydratase
MEKMVMKDLFNGIYQNKTVLITGHTGFKGSWLAYWLEKMGANVIGYSLPAPTQPNHFSLLNLNMISVEGDIRNFDQLDRVFEQYKPDIVFHLAAQALVRLSYQDPIETYETNVIGTLKVFEACRKHNVNSIVNVTSDKAYENKEWIWGYKETDELGGHDPYSSSKGCADILANSYRKSYFNVDSYAKEHNTLLASCRAGNVIGGGDWAKDRLIVDVVHSIISEKDVCIRSPDAVRPWQHVLEPLSGYLLIGQKLLEKRVEFSDSWNFGPSDEGVMTVKKLVEKTKQYWDKLNYRIESSVSQPHEAKLLRLDCSKSRLYLDWDNVWSSDATLKSTIEWYRSFYENNEVSTENNLIDYINDAKKKKLCWTN